MHATLHYCFSLRSSPEPWIFEASFQSCGLAWHKLGDKRQKQQYQQAGTLEDERTGKAMQSMISKTTACTHVPQSCIELAFCTQVP